MKRKFIAAALLGLLIPAQGMAWWSQDWQHRRKVTLDAPAVAGLSQTLRRAPILVRLHGGTVDFTQFKPDGSDIRFVAGDDKTPLNHHIERFDPSAEIALIWVDVPELVPGKPREIWLYNGGQGQKVAIYPAATFDGEQSLILHLSDANGAPVDQTANHNKVVATGTTPVVDGVVAGGLALKPASQIRIEPSQSLNVEPGGQLTWSAWIKSDLTGAAPDAAIYTKLSSGGEASLERLTVGLRGGMPYVRLGGAEPKEAVALTGITAGTWVHVAVTAGESQVTLFVNGTQAAHLAGELPALAGADVIGSVGGAPGFAGSIDEIGRANTARPASYLAVMAQSQSHLSRFATVSPTVEEQGNQSRGYVKILFSALTPDAWVVILILLGMAVASWMIMASKTQLLGRTVKANRKFFAAFRQQMNTRDRYTLLAASTIGRESQSSSLGRLYTIAQDELELRLTESRAFGTPYRLVPESIAMIRSSLDAARIHEEQRLSKRMVLLTIAIAGGPFLGLLGTVVGVMITFAGVAAAGEVNITAIAPGIAAALLATVAGLGVAIPALFGYNYLNSQLDEISDSHEIFVDEIEKRIAETYRFDTATSPFAR